MKFNMLFHFFINRYGGIEDEEDSNSLHSCSQQSGSTPHYNNSCCEMMSSPHSDMGDNRRMLECQQPSPGDPSLRGEYFLSLNLETYYFMYLKKKCQLLTERNHYIMPYAFQLNKIGFYNSECNWSKTSSECIFY